MHRYFHSLDRLVVYRKILIFKPIDLSKHETHTILFNRCSCDELKLVKKVKKTCDLGPQI